MAAPQQSQPRARAKQIAEIMAGSKQGHSPFQLSDLRAQHLVSVSIPVGIMSVSIGR